MNKYIAKDFERLDNIVFKHYGSLENFKEVLEINTHLEAILKAGDIVFLPIVKAKEIKQNKLW